MAGRANPVMDLITRGGAAASNSFSAAARAGAIATQQFQNSASMALKMDQLLQQEEDRLYNRQMQSQKMLQDTMQNSLNNQFRQDQAMRQQSNADRTFDQTSLNQERTYNQAVTSSNRTYELASDRAETQKSQFKKTFKQTQDNWDDKFEYTAAHNALSEIPKTIKKTVNEYVVEVPNPDRYAANVAMNKQFNTNYPTKGPEINTPVYNPQFKVSEKSSAETEEPPATLPGASKKGTTEVAHNAIDDIKFSSTGGGEEYTKAISAIQNVASTGGTITPEQEQYIKNNVPPVYHAGVSNMVKGVNAKNKDKVTPPASLKTKPTPVDVNIVQGTSSSITPAQYFRVPTMTAINSEGVYEMVENESKSSVAVLSDGKRVTMFKNNVYGPNGGLSKKRDMSVTGSRILPNPDFVITALPDDKILDYVDTIGQDRSTTQTYKDSYYKSIVQYKPYLLANTQFVSDMYNTVENNKIGAGSALFKQIKASLASKLDSGVLDAEYIIPVQNMIDARVHQSIPNKKIASDLESVTNDIAEKLTTQKEGRTKGGEWARGFVKGSLKMVTLGFGNTDNINNYGIDTGLKENKDNLALGLKNAVQADYEKYGSSPTYVRMQAVKKVHKYVDTSFSQLAIDIEPWEELHNGLSRTMEEKEVASIMQSITGTKREDVFKDEYKRQKESSEIKQQSTVYGKFLEDLTMSISRQNEVGTESHKSKVLVEVNGKEINIPLDTAYKLIGFDEYATVGSNQ